MWYVQIHAVCISVYWAEVVLYSAVYNLASASAYTNTQRQFDEK